MATVAPFVSGAAAALGARSLLVRVLVAKFRRDLAKLNAGEHRPLLASYAEDAVLVFNEGDHRWSGEHRGRAAIDRFLRDFAKAGIQGELDDVWIGGGHRGPSRSSRALTTARTPRVRTNRSTRTAW